MASRRLKSDRFFTRDYTAETYTWPGSTGSTRRACATSCSATSRSSSRRCVGSTTRSSRGRGSAREPRPGIHGLGGRKGDVRAFLLESGNELTLVDTLFEDDAEQVLEAIDRLGRKPGDLKRIALTTHPATSAGSRRSSARRARPCSATPRRRTSSRATAPPSPSASSRRALQDLPVPGRDLPESAAARRARSTRLEDGDQAGRCRCCTCRGTRPAISASTGPNAAS